MGLNRIFGMVGQQFGVTELNIRDPSKQPSTKWEIKLRKVMHTWTLRSQILPEDLQFLENIHRIYEERQSWHDLLYKRLPLLHRHDEYQYLYRVHVGDTWKEKDFERTIERGGHSFFTFVYIHSDIHLHCVKDTTRSVADWGIHNLARTQFSCQNSQYQAGF